MKERVKQMEAEAAALREMHAAAEKENAQKASEEGQDMETEDDRAAADNRSVYVGNVCPPSHFGRANDKLSRCLCYVGGLHWHT